MTWHRYRTIKNGGSAPATLGFNAVAPEWLSLSGAAEAAPAVPAPESTLGSHPCVALSSAQVISEWINRSLAVNAFPANGDNPLNFVSHSRGPLQATEASGGEERAAGTGGNLELDAEIRRRAYQLYVERGGEHGRDLDDWLQAKREFESGAL